MRRSLDVLLRIVNFSDRFSVLGRRNFLTVSNSDATLLSAQPAEGFPSHFEAHSVPGEIFFSPNLQLLPKK